MIELMQQKTLTSCGQTCIAMVAGIPWEEAVKLVGHSHGTRTKEIVTALRSLRFVVKDRLTTFKKHETPDGFMMVKLCYKPGNRSHWIVFYGGHYYDPAHGFDPPKQPGWKFSSYLRIGFPKISAKLGTHSLCSYEYRGKLEEGQKIWVCSDYDVRVSLWTQVHVDKIEPTHVFLSM